MRDATLTRRHFELIAATINSLPLGEDGAESRRTIAYHFAAVLKDSNKAFSTDAFVNAALKSDMKKINQTRARPSLQLAISPTEGILVQKHTGANGS